MFGAHISTGQFDPGKLHEIWFAHRSEMDLETRMAIRIHLLLMDDLDQASDPIGDLWYSA